MRAAAQSFWDLSCLLTAAPTLGVPRRTKTMLDGSPKRSWSRIHRSDQLSWTNTLYLRRSRPNL